MRQAEATVGSSVESLDHALDVLDVVLGLHLDVDVGGAGAEVQGGGGGAAWR